MDLKFSKLIFVFIFSSLTAITQTTDFIKYYTRPLTSFYANDFIHTMDDGYVLTGYMTSPFLGGAHNYFILKYNNIGDTLWYRDDGSLNDNDGKFVIETSDSCYIVCTNKAPINMIKYDRNGNFLWERSHFPVPGFSFLFNTLLEINNKLYAFGSAISSSDSVVDVMYKFDMNGDSLSILYNTPFNSRFNRRTAIKYKNDLIALSGNVFDSSASLNQPRIGIIDTNGFVILNKTIPIIQSTGGYIIEESFDNGFYFYTTPTSYMLKLDSIGNILWSKEFGVGIEYSPAKIDSNTFLLMGRGYSYVYLNDSGQFIPYTPFDYPYNGSMEVGNIIVRGNKLIMGGAGTDSVTNGSECIIVQFDLSNVTSITETKSKKSILLYPNPVPRDNGKIFLFLPDEKIKNLYIYNSVGQIVENFKRYNSTSVTQISIENFCLGIYFIEVFDSKNNRYVDRFVVN